MSKQVVQDILPPKEERSIRKIPLPEKRSGSFRPQQTGRIPESNTNNQPPTPISYNKNRQAPRKFKIWKVLVPILLLLVIFLGLFAFGKAEVEITPRKLSYDVDTTITVGGEEGILPFQIKTVTNEVSREAESTGEETVERRASGEIIIFNNHSSKSQPLIKNTRFETPGGLIYRINESITVPGTTEKGGKTTPGQLKVMVYADSPGEDYNVGLTDFTIPGFKGLPQYNNFFARSSTEMSGGFIGKVKTVGEGAEETIRQELRVELQTTLKNSIIAETPENYILLPLSVRTSSVSLPTEEKGGMVVIKEKGTLSGIILPRNELQNYISSNIVSDASETKITNLEVLSYEIVDQPEYREDLENMESFEMKLKGKAVIVWVVSEEEIRSKLAGTPKKNLKENLTQFTSIERAEAILKPFWKRKFPKNPEKIEIKIIAEEKTL